jgi:hypothetical protein
MRQSLGTATVMHNVKMASREEIQLETHCVRIDSLDQRNIYVETGISPSSPGVRPRTIRMAESPRRLLVSFIHLIHFMRGHA